MNICEHLRMVLPSPRTSTTPAACAVQPAGPAQQDRQLLNFLAVVRPARTYTNMHVGGRWGRGGVRWGGAGGEWGGKGRGRAGWKRARDGRGSWPPKASAPTPPPPQCTQAWGAHPSPSPQASAPTPQPRARPSTSVPTHREQAPSLATAHPPRYGMRPDAPTVLIDDAVSMRAMQAEVSAIAASFCSPAVAPGVGAAELGAPPRFAASAAACPAFTASSQPAEGCHRKVCSVQDGVGGRWDGQRLGRGRAAEYVQARSLLSNAGPGQRLERPLPVGWNGMKGDGDWQADAAVRHASGRFELLGCRYDL